MFFWDQHKTITSCYALLAKSVCEKYQLTQMEYDILMFLHNNPQHKTAADMVRIRKSTKSHVSASLQTLERKGLILRTQSAANKRRISRNRPISRSIRCFFLYRRRLCLNLRGDPLFKKLFFDNHRTRARTRSGAADIKHQTDQPQIPDLMEAVFDLFYLTFDLIAGILLFVFAKGSSLFILCRL